MPTFAIESPQTGQKYQVQFDREPTPEDVDFAAQHFDKEWWQQQGIEPGSAITQQTPLETVGNAIANVGPNLAGMVGGGMRYLDKAAQVLADATGTQRGGLFGDIAQQAEGLQAEGDVLRPLSPANPTAQTIGQGASQGIGLMASAAASVPALGARGLMAVPAALGFGAGGGEGVQQGEAMGLSPMGQLAQGTAFGIAEGATEAMGGIGGKFLRPAKTMLGRMAGGVASETIEEPAAGMLQEAITNVSGLAVADPKRPGFTTTGFQLPGPAGYLDRRTQEAIGGAAGGLVFAGVQPFMRAPGVGQPVSQAPATTPSPLPRGDSPLADIAARGGRVDAVPLAPEDTGPLTPEDVADLETASAEPRTRQPILTNVPDRPPVAVAATPPADQTVPDAAAAAAVTPPRPTDTAGGRIVAAAVIQPDGSIATGRTHRLADPTVSPDRLARETPNFGFIVEMPDGSRSFVSREQAAVIAQNNGQLMAGQTIERGRLHSDQVKMEKVSPAQEAVPQTDILPDTAANPNPPQTITGSNVQTGTEMPVPPPTAAAGAGAGGVTPNAAQVPIMITRDMRQQLYDQGMSKKDVDALTPAQAQDILTPTNTTASTPATAAAPAPAATSAPARMGGGRESGGTGGVASGKAVEMMTPVEWVDATQSPGFQRLFREGGQINQEAILAPYRDAIHAAMLKGKPVSQEAMKHATGYGLPKGKLEKAAAKYRWSAQGDYRPISNATSTTAALPANLQMPAGTSQNPAMASAPATPAASRNLNPTARQPKPGEAGFVNAQILTELATAAVRAGKSFATWAREMLARFGEAVRAQLASIWQQATAQVQGGTVRFGGTVTQMAPSATRGFVAAPGSSPIPEGQDVTRSRFASPDDAANLYDIQATETMRGESAAWIDANGLDAALAALESNTPPAGLRIDHLPSLGSALITRLAKLAETGTEAQRIAADVMLEKAGKAWHGDASQQAGRTLQQRAMANQELMGIAPILATKQVLVDRADRVIKERFEGGAEGAVEKVKDIDTKAGTEASTELATDLDAETSKPTSKGGNAIPPSKVRAKHPNLKKLLDALRKKIAPGMTWADIFMTLPAEQKARQREIYRRLMLDERLKALNQGERLQLTNELDRAWQRERRKVFMRELEKITKLGKSKKDKDKVKAALPRLLRLMNLGMLNSETFRGAIAQEYGIKQIDAATGAELRKLGEQIQQAPEGLPRRKLEVQLLDRLQRLTGSTLMQVLDSWWTASVLSGWRTQVDIGLSILNGIEDVGLGSVVTALRTGNKDVALRALGALFGRMPSAFMEAVNHVATGNKTLIRNFEIEAKQALEGGNRLASDVGREMWDRGGWRKVPGAFMIFYGRLMTALDHLNSASTMQGAKMMALARHPDLYQKAIKISPADRAAALAQAKLEMLGGAEPTTQSERLEVAARQREILDKETPVEVLNEAVEVGRRAALQGDPSGLGGGLIDAINTVVGTVSRKAESMSKREGLDTAAKQTLALLQGMAPIMRAITGTKFARTLAHALNRTTSYVPGLGIYTVGQQGRTGAFGDILAARQVIGTLVGIALYLAFDDDEDERGIEDGWKDKTPQEKAQLYAQGKQPFTVWERDAQGRVVSWNYQQWGIAGIVNTVAQMLKQKNSEQGALHVLMTSLTQGMMSFTDKAQLQGLQTVFGEKSRSTDPVSDIAANLNKWAAQTVGGLIPRLVKDIDMVASPELRTSSEWWQKWAKEVPMLRQLSSGKRVDIFGEDIKLDRGPLSRVVQIGTADPDYRLLARLNERDVYLPDPTQGVRVVKLADGTRRSMTEAEKDRYQRATGKAYRQYIRDNGAALLQMEPEKAREAISARTKRLRDIAAYQATH